MNRFLLHLCAVALLGLAILSVCNLCTSDGSVTIPLHIQLFADSSEDRVSMGTSWLSTVFCVVGQMHPSQADQWVIINAHHTLFHSHRKFGFEFSHGMDFLIERVVGPNSTDPEHGISYSRGIVIAIPTALALPIMTGFPLWFWARTLLARRRSRHGFCSDCGYDLRATPERCPECGAIPRHSKQTLPRLDLTRRSQMKIDEHR